MKAEFFESKKAQKDLVKAPKVIVNAYEIWARLIEIHGTQVLRNFKAYHDEKLSGEWAGHRSSRLNRKWRVIYRAHSSGKLEIVEVMRITAHDYRRKG